MDIDTFLTAYAGELTRLLGPLDPAMRTPEEELAAAEERLSRPLPPMLRGLYQLCGNAGNIHSAFNRLLPPDELHLLDDGALVFFEENQRVVRWAIRAEDPQSGDPAVVQYLAGPRLDWYPDTASLSLFLLKQFYWNAVNGALPCCSAAAIAPRSLKELKSSWMLVNQDQDATIYTKRRCVVCVVGDPSSPTAHVGAQDRSGLVELEEIGLTVRVDEVSHPAIG